MQQRKTRRCLFFSEDQWLFGHELQLYSLVFEFSGYINNHHSTTTSRYRVLVLGCSSPANSWILGDYCIEADRLAIIDKDASIGMLISYDHSLQYISGPLETANTSQRRISRSQGHRSRPFKIIQSVYRVWTGTHIFFSFNYKGAVHHHNDLEEPQIHALLLHGSRILYITHSNIITNPSRVVLYNLPSAIKVQEPVNQLASTSSALERRRFV